MQKLLLAILLSVLSLATGAQCVTNVNFNTWGQAGQPGNGNWSVQGGGTTIYQSVNGAPTFFVSPFDMMNVHISGNFRSTDNDNDWMGFVFSFLNPMTGIDSFDTYLCDWKQEQQDGASSGLALNRVNGVIPGAQYTTTFWNHTNTPEFTVLQNNFGGQGWNQGTNHRFDLYLTYTRAIIDIDGIPVFDWTDCYKPGRFGFYNYSQRDCYYSNFQYELYINFSSPPKVCRGNPAAFNFTNSCVPVLGQYQSMTWDFGDGTTPVVITNPTLNNVNVTHTYAAAGTYNATLTVVDNNGCSATATNVVDVRNPIVLNRTLNQPPCNGGSNGGIVLTPSAGFGNYTYNWSNGTTQKDLVGATAGTYTITVTDGVCNTSAQYTLGQPSALSAVTSHTDATCGASNGTATITISGGTGPYYGTPIPTGVNWGIGHPGTTATGLAPGTFVADFRDANNCSSLLQYRETIGSLPCGITSNVTKTNVTCFGGNNGSATVTVTGSTPPVLITWSNGATGVTASNLAAGTYTFTYTDGNASHNFNGSVTITQPGAAMVAQIATVPISCAGANNGQALASVVSGGVPPYTYAWIGGHPNSPTVSNLAPGSITVTVTDSRGCTATATGTVSGVPSLTATVTTVMDSCWHYGKGKATVSVSGGVPPYTYSWNNLSTDTTNRNLIRGTYTVTITDYNGCTISRTATVGGPANSFAKTFTTQHITCFGGNDGNFNITTTGGTPGYTYTWSPNTVSGNNPTGLTAGIYNFTITDTYGCTLIGNDTLLEPANGVTAVSSHTDVTCNGANNGTLTITISGGVPPYTYQGLPIPPGTNTLTGLAGGTYSGTVLDASGCSVLVNETILEPAAFTVTETHVDVACNGGSTGSIDITPAGGTLPYSFVWNDAVVTEDRTNIPAGSYSVICTDSNLCSATISVTISEPTALSITETHSDVLCNGGSTGSINTTPVGGIPAYTFLWNDGDMNQNRLNLPVGTYSVTTTDNNLCTASVSVTIAEPTALTVTTSHTDVNCYGANDGTVTVNISGGTSPYTYLGTPIPPGTTVIPNLAPNTYSGNVTDANGCSVAVSETITEPLPQSITVTGTDNVCFGATLGTASANFVNPTGSVTYDWAGGLTGANISNLTAGTYTVTATDQNNCMLVGSYTVTEPAAVVMSVSTTDATCFGGNGSATATPVGGNPPFTYLWSNGGTGQTTPLPAGSYTVSSTDASTCQQTASLTINQPTQIVIQETHTNVSCFGISDGSITLSVNGGTGTSYTYNWNPNVSSSNSASGLPAANYDIIVTDENSCTVLQSVPITSPTQLSVNLTSTDPVCFGASTGSAIAAGNGGTPAYNYLWSNSVAGAVNSNIGSGSYSVTITDANSCTASSGITLNDPVQFTSTVSAADVSCYQFSDGQINVSVNAGTPAYNYTLSNTAQNNTGLFNGLSAGSYTVTVTDANSCSTSGSAVINEPDPVVVSATPANVTLDMGESIQLQASSNQSGTLTYSWLPASGLSCYDCPNPTFESNNSAVYTVSITSAMGCIGSSIVTINVVPAYDVFIPNAFTPNGDGINDTWQIFGKLKGIKQIQIMVFNRWGEKVFESSDVNFLWDGHYKGASLPAAVYTYAAKFVWLDNHSDNNYKGTVTLLK